MALSNLTFIFALSLLSLLSPNLSTLLYSLISRFLFIFFFVWCLAWVYDRVTSPLQCVHVAPKKKKKEKTKQQAKQNNQTHNKVLFVLPRRADNKKAEVGKRAGNENMPFPPSLNERNFSPCFFFRFSRFFAHFVKKFEGSGGDGVLLSGICSLRPGGANVEPPG